MILQKYFIIIIIIINAGNTAAKNFVFWCVTMHVCLSHLINVMCMNS